MSAIIEGMQSLKNITLDMAQELRPYSGQVATAFALNERDRINMLLERDARVGDDIAQLVRLQSKFELTWEDFKTKLLITITPYLNDALEIAIAGLEATKSLSEKVEDSWEDFKDWGVKTFLPPIAQFAYNSAKLREQQEEEEKRRAIEKDLSDFMIGADTTIPEPIPFPTRNIPSGGAF